MHLTTRLSSYIASPRMMRHGRTADAWLMRWTSASLGGSWNPSPLLHLQPQLAAALQAARHQSPGKTARGSDLSTHRQRKESLHNPGRSRRFHTVYSMHRLCETITTAHCSPTHSRFNASLSALDLMCICGLKIAPMPNTTFQTRWQLHEGRLTSHRCLSAQSPEPQPSSPSGVATAESPFGARRILNHVSTANNLHLSPTFASGPPHSVAAL